MSVLQIVKWCQRHHEFVKSTYDTPSSPCYQLVGDLGNGYWLANWYEDEPHCRSVFFQVERVTIENDVVVDSDEVTSHYEEPRN